MLRATICTLHDWQEIKLCFGVKNWLIFSDLSVAGVLILLPIPVYVCKYGQHSRVSVTLAGWTSYYVFPKNLKNDQCVTVVQFDYDTSIHFFKMNKMKSTSTMVSTQIFLYLQYKAVHP